MKKILVFALLVLPLLGDNGAWQKRAFPSQTTTVQMVKPGPGVFGGYYVSNAANASSACLQVFDSTMTVTLGTTTPSMIYEIPAGSAANVEISQGVSMVNGIQIAVATTCSGNTAPGSGTNLTIYYK